MSRLTILTQRQSGLCALTISAEGEMQIHDYGLHCAFECRKCMHNLPIGAWLCLG